MTTDQTSALDAAVTAVLRAEAAAQHLAWPALAARSGVSKSSMSNYLNDVSPLKLAVVDSIAGALGMDILEVLAEARKRMARAMAASPAPELAASDTAPTVAPRPAADTPPLGGPKVVQPTRRSASSRGKRSHESN